MVSASTAGVVSAVDDVLNVAVAAGSGVASGTPNPAFDDVLNADVAAGSGGAAGFSAAGAVPGISVVAGSGVAAGSSAADAGMTCVCTVSATRR